MYQFWNKKNWSYKKYKDAQVSLNKRKIKTIWVTKEDIKYISQFVKGEGICHGARNGFEVREFGKYVKAIGTDISDTARRYGLVQWDFHKQNPDWIGKFDFVYTNSFDHSHDPELSFKIFMEQLKPGGKCIIHTGAKMEVLPGYPGDCFGASKEELLKLTKAEFYTFNNRNIYITTK